MQIQTTGNALIDSATAEIAVALRDAGHMRGVCYAEAQRLRDEIIVGALDRAGVLPPWRPANNGSGKRIWFLIRDESAPLIPRCCREPRPMAGGLIEFIGKTGRTQELYCMTCRAVIAQLTWNVEMS